MFCSQRNVPLWGREPFRFGNLLSACAAFVQFARQASTTMHKTKIIRSPGVTGSVTHTHTHTRTRARSRRRTHARTHARRCIISKTRLPALAPSTGLSKAWGYLGSLNGQEHVRDALAAPTGPSNPYCRAFKIVKDMFLYTLSPDRALKPAGLAWGMKHDKNM